MNYKVSLHQTLHTFTVFPKEAILDAALRQGFTFPHGCRSGSCGACMGQIITGNIDYAGKEPYALFEDEKKAGKALFCIAHAKSNLIIDVREVAAPEELTPEYYTAILKEAVWLNETLVRVWLRLDEGRRMTYLAGQYVEFEYYGKHYPYSIANAPHEDDCLEFHMRVNAESKNLIQHILDKKPIALLGPKGGCVWHENPPKEVLLLASGTGFAPQKAMIEHALCENIHSYLHLVRFSKTNDFYLDDLVRRFEKHIPRFRCTRLATDLLPGDFGSNIASWQKCWVYASGAPTQIIDLFAQCQQFGLPPQQFFTDMPL